MSIKFLQFEKMETMLGQTFYVKKYERVERKNSIKNNIQADLFKTVISKPITNQITFSLGPQSVQELMDNPLLTRITFKKNIDHI
ncbi:hypothetical protein [Desulfolucanica intricata]|uniref:hypothetical protein n=1 Tax=Desulfolucanica intricata TaxID=1285191 RepID=UPI000836244D|nr:hypothetical protein [Desulfolucanica intricata]